MSLLREALRKASTDTEPPSSFSPNPGLKKKKTGPFQITKSGVIVLLLLGLGGVLIFLFLPTTPPILRKPASPIPKQIVKIVEPKLQPPEGAVSTLTPAAMEPDPRLQRSMPAKGILEKGPAQNPEEIDKTGPPRFLIPKGTAKKLARPPASTKRAVKESPPSEIPEAPQARTGQEDRDSLEWVRLFDEGVQSQQKGLFIQAIQAYQELLALRPNHWETYNNLGLIYDEQMQYSKAREMFQKALVLNPHYLKGHNNLGLLYLRLGKLQEAVDSFGKALDLDPNFLPAYINLSTAYKRQGRIDLARKCLLKALDHDSESLEAHYNLGLLWENEGAKEKAQEHFQKFVSKAQGPYGQLADDLRKRWPGLK